ncbi:uncharacterized protein AMSG_12165 [Thecamonas trahens ATCC 50062]|uniref:Uncharacterized protein n=1 Tax=Thecamonas trahens ATCC 50062 TaxID=461836 RepID=A0A0L0DM36_THETB|nr:hypothetical protein AMSG_12165 [Thecamonas trahens ATCC 50062]KNC52453.1 hypothetical protein AMSG_12165 [Thecamonas trahens ATCC 50062]|eukprot:XP_013755505.1 hypothetical protein AMSG_12165 [Thecamonas trahens ATCC 50062]
MLPQHGLRLAEKDSDLGVDGLVGGLALLELVLEHDDLLLGGRVRGAELLVDAAKLAALRLGLGNLGRLNVELVTEHGNAGERLGRPRLGTGDGLASLGRIGLGLAQLLGGRTELLLQVDLGRGLLGEPGLDLGDLGLEPLADALDGRRATPVGAGEPRLEVLKLALLGDVVLLQPHVGVVGPDEFGLELVDLLVERHLDLLLAKILNLSLEVTAGGVERRECGPLLLELENNRLQPVLHGLALRPDRLELLDRVGKVLLRLARRHLGPLAGNVALGAETGLLLELGRRHRELRRELVDDLVVLGLLPLQRRELVGHVLLLVRQPPARLLELELLPLLRRRLLRQHLDVLEQLPARLLERLGLLLNLRLVTLLEVGELVECLDLLVLPLLAERLLLCKAVADLLELGVDKVELLGSLLGRRNRVVVVVLHRLDLGLGRLGGRVERRDLRKELLVLGERLGLRRAQSRNLILGALHEALGRRQPVRQVLVLRHEPAVGLFKLGPALNFVVEAGDGGSSLTLSPLQLLLHRRVLALGVVKQLLESLALGTALALGVLECLDFHSRICRSLLLDLGNLQNVLSLELIGCLRAHARRRGLELRLKLLDLELELAPLVRLSRLGPDRNLVRVAQVLNLRRELVVRRRQRAHVPLQDFETRLGIGELRPRNLELTLRRLGLLLRLEELGVDLGSLSLVLLGKLARLPCLGLLLGHRSLDLHLGAGARAGDAGRATAAGLALELDDLEIKLRDTRLKRTLLLLELGHPGVVGVLERVAVLLELRVLLTTEVLDLLPLLDSVLELLLELLHLLSEKLLRPLHMLGEQLLLRHVLLQLADGDLELLACPDIGVTPRLQLRHLCRNLRLCRIHLLAPQLGLER